MRAVCGSLVTFALIAACGQGGSGRPTEADTTAVRASGVRPDTGSVPAAAQRFVPVPLPDGFPSDFPLPPDRVVVEASSDRDETGILSRVGLAVQGETEERYAWYRRALADAGWQIATESRGGGALSLHATQGESYVDLSVGPYPNDDAEGWVLVEASIWRLEPL